MRDAGFSLASVRDEQRLRRRYSINDLGIAAPVITSYNGVVAAAAPQLWWKLNETSGTTAADSGSGGHPGTLTGGATFAGSGVSVAAPSGYAGLGSGIDLSAASVTDVGGAAAGVSFGTNATGAWTVQIWMAGSAGSGYAASRSNDAAIINQFVSDKVEFFASGFSGSDPRTGSQISLPASDTTTPHLITYCYNNGTWSGFKDGVSVFSVSRSFGCVLTAATIRVGSDGGTSTCASRVWDFQIYNRALSGTEIADIYAARNNP
jgi:hypothetical protein